MTAISRKGPWHLSKTMAAQTGMTNKWLAEQGLISVKEQWVKIHYPATARNLREPPGADPHAGWCGGWGDKTLRLPDWLLAPVWLSQYDPNHPRTSL